MSFSDIFSEQEYTKSTKTDDELKRLTLEEDLSETKRSFHILTKGQHLQKSAEDIQNQDEDLQIQAADSLVRAIQAKFMSSDQMKATFSLTLVMLKIWSQPVLDAWVLVFRELITILPYTTVEDDANKIILYLSDSSQPAVSRYIAGRMIGFVADIRKDRIKGVLFERSRALCQDHDTEVRKVLAKEVMFKICSRISSDQIEMHLLDKVLQLVYDSEINVKCFGIELIFNIAPFLSPEEQKNRVCKIFLELLSSPKEEVQIKMSSLIGSAFNQLAPIFGKNGSSIGQILQTFKDYGCHKNWRVRENFAYNLPAILHLTDSIVSFEKLRSTYLKLLIKDDCKEVRQKLVSSFHEVTGLIEPDVCMKYLFPIFKDLLREPDAEITSRITENIHITVKNFVKAATAIQVAEEANEKENPDDSTPKSSSQASTQQPPSTEESLMTLLIQFANDQTKKHSWRIKAQLFDNIAKCLDVFNMANFGKNFLPMIMQSMRNESDLVRYSAAGVVSTFIKSNEHSAKSKEVFTELLGASFLKSPTYQQRISFIYFAEHATNCFSRRFFKKHKLFNVLDLASDKVKNVRVKLARALPKIRYMLNFDEDDDDENMTIMDSKSNLAVDDEIDKYDKALSKLTNKKDLIVSQEADRAVKEIERINFDSEQVTRKIQQQDEERQRNEDRLLEIEQKLQEEPTKPEKDDFDYLFRNGNSTSCASSTNPNFIHNYKKRYSARFTMSPIIPPSSSSIKSKLSITTMTNTNSLTSLTKSNSTSQSTTPQLPSIYNSSSLKSSSSNPTSKKIVKRSSLEQKPSSASMTNSPLLSSASSSLSYSQPPLVTRAGSSILPQKISAFATTSGSEYKHSNSGLSSVINKTSGTSSSLPLRKKI